MSGYVQEPGIELDEEFGEPAPAGEELALSGPAVDGIRAEAYRSGWETGYDLGHQAAAENLPGRRVVASPPGGRVDGVPELTLGRDGGHAIIQGLVDAMRHVPVVGKGGYKAEGEGGSWTYRSADAVTSAANVALAEAGVAVLPTVVGREEITLRAWGKATDAYETTMDVVFLSAVDGSALRMRMVSHSVGRDAYGIGASYTYLMKYALSLALQVPFDDKRMDLEDPENRSNQGQGAEMPRDMVSSGSTPAPEGLWSRLGWGSQAEHDQARKELMDAVRSLKAKALAGAKDQLAKLVADPASGEPVWVWDPNGKRGKGLVTPVISAESMAAARGIVATVAGDPDLFEDRSAMESAAAPAPAPTPGPDVPGPAPAQEGPETGGSPGSRSALAAASPGGIRQEIHRVFLRVGESDATEVEAELHRVGLWPIESIPDDRAEEAATLVANTLGLA